jgi:hypothetical protein
MLLTKCIILILLNHREHQFIHERFPSFIVRFQLKHMINQLKIGNRPRKRPISQQKLIKLLIPINTNQITGHSFILIFFLFQFDLIFNFQFINITHSFLKLLPLQHNIHQLFYLVIMKICQYFARASCFICFVFLYDSI